MISVKRERRRINHASTMSLAHSMDNLGRFEFTASEHARFLRHTDTLQEMFLTGEAQHFLAGRRLALLCATDQSSEAIAFRLAAIELGAQVSHIGNGIALLHNGRDLIESAKFLGRLYDAVECEGLPTNVVQCIAVESGIPVFVHLGKRVLAGFDQIDEDARAEKRHRLLQAVLLSKIG